MKMHVLVRFGKWREIIDAPMPQDPKLYCVSTCMHHYAKGIAYAAMKEFTKAEHHKRQFYGALKRVHPGRKFFNNQAIETLGVGEKMLLGNWSTTKAITRLLMRICVKACSVAMIYTIPSHGPGCIRHAMLWELY